MSNYQKVFRFCIVHSIPMIFPWWWVFLAFSSSIFPLYPHYSRPSGSLGTTPILRRRQEAASRQGPRSDLNILNDLRCCLKMVGKHGNMWKKPEDTQDMSRSFEKSLSIPWLGKSLEDHTPTSQNHCILIGVCNSRHFEKTSCVLRRKAAAAHIWVPWRRPKFWSVEDSSISVIIIVGDTSYEMRLPNGPLIGGNWPVLFFDRVLMN